MDIAPAVLHLLQMPILSGLEGKSLAVNTLRIPISDLSDQSALNIVDYKRGGRILGERIKSLEYFRSKRKKSVF